VHLQPSPLTAQLLLLLLLFVSRFLEEELARRYREAAPATLALLQERCEALAKELLAADGRLKERTDVAALRAAGGWSG
jgi:hypothetical protein